MWRKINQCNGRWQKKKRSMRESTNFEHMFWGVKFRKEGVKGVANMPSQVPIGRRFILNKTMKLDLETMEECMKIGKSLHYENFQFMSKYKESARESNEETNVIKTSLKMDLSECHPKKREQYRL